MNYLFALLPLLSFVVFYSLLLFYFGAGCPILFLSPSNFAHLYPVPDYLPTFHGAFCCPDYFVVVVVFVVVYCFADAVLLLYCCCFVVCFALLDFVFVILFVDFFWLLVFLLALLCA